MSELPVPDWSLDLEPRRGLTAVLLIFRRVGVRLFGIYVLRWRGIARGSGWPATEK
jgi:hypothetical protein